MESNDIMVLSNVSIDKCNKLPTVDECTQLETILQGAQREGKLSEQQVKNIMVKTMEFFYKGCTRVSSTGRYVMTYNGSRGVHTLLPI